MIIHLTWLLEMLARKEAPRLLCVNWLSVTQSRK